MRCLLCIDALQQGLPCRNRSGSFIRSIHNNIKGAAETIRKNGPVDPVREYVLMIAS